MSWPKFVSFRLAPFLLLLCALTATGAMLTRPVFLRADDADGANTIQRKTESYSVSAAWPAVGIPRVDEESKAFVLAQIDQFVEEVEEINRDLEQMSQEDESFTYNAIPSELTITYTLGDESPATVSILWNIFSYTGGAHGQLLLQSNNYDRETGFPLLLEDLFQDLNLALLQFTREARSQLATPDEEREDQDFVDDMLRTGTEPLEESFRTFTLMPDGIRLYFSPYQVAPWAAGSPQVEVSLESLEQAKPNLQYWGIGE